jgi:hypothetical protein
MSNLGFFGWLREGVRRSVLLGVSDAVEQLGLPSEGAELHPQLAAALCERTGRLGDGAERPSDRRSERKRLGRSLTQLRTPAAPATIQAGPATPAGE